MNRFLLELKDPTIRTYLDYAFIFSMRGEGEAFENHLFHHYGNLCFVNSFYQEIWDPFDFYPAPRLKQLSRSGVITSHGFDLWRASDKEDVIADFLKNRLRAGEYCYVVLDEYYLPGKESYRSKHYIHHSLIVGIDLDRRQVALVSYFQLKNSDFGTRWVTLSEFREAFAYDSNKLEGSPQEQFSIWNYKYVESFRINKAGCDRLDLSVFTGQISDYLNSTSSPCDAKSHNKDLSKYKVSFGLSVYDRLQEWVEKMASGEFTIGNHPTRLFSEHKDYLLLRLQILQQRNAFNFPISLMGEISSVVQLAREIRFTMLAATSQHSTEVFDRVLAGFQACRRQEARCYEELLNYLLVKRRDKAAR